MSRSTMEADEKALPLESQQQQQQQQQQHSPDGPQHIQFSAAAVNGLSSTTSDLGHNPGAPRSGGVSQPIDNGPEPGGGILRRRLTRAVTFRSVDEYGEHEGQTNWEPGSEPGLDPRTHDGPLVWCRIVVVEWSVEKVQVHEYNNHSFMDFLKKPMDPWVRCRWISINGISPDVIHALAAHKNLHKLAVDDLMEPRNRTKADWYLNHAYIVLTMQRVVKVTEDESSSDNDEDDVGGGGGGGGGGSTATADAQSTITTATTTTTTAVLPRSQIFRRLRRWYRGGGPAVLDNEMGVLPSASTGYCPPGFQRSGAYQTLQRYHASPNYERTKFMERNSTLLVKEGGLLAIAEQVSIFLMSDNTVISFFNASAKDVEEPLLRRLRVPGTVLRESCDASLLTQAIIDTIVDFAMPLVEKYTTAIDDLELEVLLKPDIEQSRRLYIVISEVNKMLTFLNPIDNVVNSLRDHRTDLSRAEALDALLDPATGVIVTPTTHTYLGDVLDHCVMITENLIQIKQSSQNLIDLIFNTTSANQNSYMRLLTTVTIIFLPLTFITGFFGQNFEDFPETKLGIGYFWRVTIPTFISTVVLVSWFPVSASIRAYWRQRNISHERKRSLAPNSKRVSRTFHSSI